MVFIRNAVGRVLPGSFYPLRIEQYGRDEKLPLIETRITEMFNPSMVERGYGPLVPVY